MLAYFFVMYYIEDLLEKLSEHDLSTLRNKNIDINAICDIIDKENIQHYRLFLKSVNSFNAIKNLIEKWYPPYPNQLRINEVVADIEDRLSGNFCGEVFYINGKVTESSPNGKFQYKLIKRGTSCIFISYYYKKASILI